MVCGIGMVSLFVGLILWGIIGSVLIPDITINEPVIKNVIDTADGSLHEVVFLIKNDEKRSVKAELKIKLGFDSFRKRHSSSPKRSIYRVFQALQETTKEVVLTPSGEKEVLVSIEVSRGIYEKLQITPDTKIYPRVSAEKISWEAGSR